MDSMEEINLEGGLHERVTKRDIDKLASSMNGNLVVSADRIDWNGAGRIYEHAALFKLASGKSINKENFVETMTAVWKLSEESSFLKVEKDMVLVIFKTEKDLMKILEGGPWTLENGALLMQKWDSGMTSDDFSTNYVNIWVQIHRLPFELRNQKSAECFANIAGRVKEFNGLPSVARNQYEGEFPKFRIELQTNEPIVTGFFS